MPFFDGQGRDALRRMYAEAWRKHREALPVEPVEDQIVRVVELHPEYHALLQAGDEALLRDYTPEDGQANPFLHMGLHLAIRDQVATDRPRGIADAFRRLAMKHGDLHAAEHAMIDCLAKTLWQAQRAGQLPEEQAYLEALRGML
jgi:hypothetical protein